MKRELEPGTLVIVKPDSGNEKIGDAATTYAAQQSCPSACVFKDGGGCYAEDGPFGKFITAPLNRSAQASIPNPTPEMVATAEAEAIDAMPVRLGQPLRLHSVGDCSTNAAARIVGEAAARYNERGGGPVWTYTHAWETVERESWGTVSVLASCETVEQVARAQERGYATAMVVPEFEQEKLYAIEADMPYPPVRLLPCPAQTRHVPCSDCRLCFSDQARLKAGVTIGFAIHGTRFLVRKARLALTDPTSPTRKKTSRELIPPFERKFKQRYGRTPTHREVAEALGFSESSIYEMRKSLRTGKPTVKKPHRRRKT